MDNFPVKPRVGLAHLESCRHSIAYKRSVSGIVFASQNIIRYPSSSNLCDDTRIVNLVHIIVIDLREYLIKDASLWLDQHPVLHQWATSHTGPKDGINIIAGNALKQAIPGRHGGGSGDQ